MAVLGRSTRHENAAVELQEVDVLVVTGRISAVGRHQLVAHPTFHAASSERNERRARPVHAGDDQAKGGFIGGLGSLASEAS